jgi:hypothetical protein
MSVERTTVRTVTFRKPFQLGGTDGPTDGPWAAGSYLVETVEEDLDTMKTPGSRIVSVTMHVTSPGDPGVLRLVAVTSAELEGALLRDRG